MTKNQCEYSYCISCKKQVGGEKCPICKTPTIQIVENKDYFEIEPLSGNKFMIEKNPSKNMFSWDESKQYAQNLRTGGFNNWRVPTTEELKIIYQIKDACQIDKSYEWFWSSEAIDEDRAWYICLTDGNIDDDKKSDELYVICVK